MYFTDQTLFVKEEENLLLVMESFFLFQGILVCLLQVISSQQILKGYKRWVRRVIKKRRVCIYEI